MGPCQEYFLFFYFLFLQITLSGSTARLFLNSYFETTIDTKKQSSKRRSHPHGDMLCRDDMNRTKELLYCNDPRCEGVN